ncbi:chromosome partitioning protein [Azospirillum sp. Vi22]|uniref:plasmid partitioning protein RepB C-terminal domain-containing protein n=1 Tax=Azospirillum baldaniorum TaxID=1064539 RepID=UPI00157A5B52|nr:plasmid partitioning protein RepB C-terminal domain-containing protein [Azospirillum baldaniorum]NUB05179.1 chromosome partitioning protein [Azospirillum baldaniorum]
MTHVRNGFEGKTITVPVDHILPTRKLGKDIRQSPKYRTILATIREVGIIEPLAVHPEGRGTGEDDRYYILLDGHLRLEALKELGGTEAVCLVSTDDEGFTYNRRINRLSPIQEHEMILKGIEMGLAPERIAQSFDINVERIRERQQLLKGIAPEVVTMLKDRMVSQGVFAVLRKMKPMRQIVAAEMMVSASRFTVNYARMILATTRPEQLVDGRKPKPAAGVTPEDIARMEREMEKLHQDYRVVEDTLGETMLVLVVAKGFMTKLLGNAAVAAYLAKHHGDIVGELKRIMEAVASDARGPERE